MHILRIIVLITLETPKRNEYVLHIARWGSVKRPLQVNQHRYVSEWTETAGKRLNL